MPLSDWKLIEAEPKKTHYLIEVYDPYKCMWLPSQFTQLTEEESVDELKRVCGEFPHLEIRLLTYTTVTQEVER